MTAPNQAEGCRFCSSPVEFAFRAREMMHGTRSLFDYQRCLACGALQIDAFPTDLEPFYSAEYYAAREHHPKRRPDWLRSVRRGWSDSRWRRRLAGTPLAGRRYGRFAWLALTETGTQDAILDVGCGSGRLLWNLHAEGFENLTGIDARAASVCGEQGPGAGSVPSSPRILRRELVDHEGGYHLVMAHHSFEHMPDPRAALCSLRRLVLPGGWLLLRVPLADGWAARHYGPEWVQLDAPRHLNVPTRESIRRLAAQSGFEIVHDVDDSGAFQIWGSELYRADIALSEAPVEGDRLLRFRRRLAARWQARSLRRRRLGDQACFYLRPIEGPETSNDRSGGHSPAT